MISIVIVTYNSARCIGACLQSLAGAGAEVVVVDNDSSDETPDVVRRFEGIQFVTPGRNLGFAAGANLGARNSGGENLLFLNPDTICRSEIAPLEELLTRRREVVAVAPRLVDSAGRTQLGFVVRRLPTLPALLFEVLLINRIVPSNPVNRRYRCLDWDPDRPAEVAQPAGACLLVRRENFESLGGFDENFHPLWFEDVDLCLRLRHAGGMIWYEPRVVFEHSGGHSLESVTFSEKQVYWYRSMIYYVRKNKGLMAEMILRLALLVGIGLRIAGELAGGLFGNSFTVGRRGARIRAYWQVARISCTVRDGGAQPKASSSA
jgi:N-acetylglucosaminyl-diphospho-decaprenol L-rhamnosyltransferase